MSELRELYQEVILDHSKTPRNFRTAEDASHTAEGHNPLCGDKVTVYARVKEGVVTEASFQGSGCAISTASASLMTEAVTGKTVDDVESLFAEFQQLVTGGGDSSMTNGALGKLAVFRGVCEFPIRVKCATLAWHTLKAALRKSEDTVSTE